MGENKFLQNLKKATESIDVDAMKEMAVATGNTIKEKTGEATIVLTEKTLELKEQADKKKTEITEKLTELDRMLESTITEYNEAYTLMNDKGVGLYIERTRAIDTVANVETIVNSIANHPKEFDTDFEEIHTNRDRFQEVCDFADRELKTAREAAGSAGAGLAAGASVAFMAPTAAMWIASTFGTASTGVAISTLSGAAAESAALAWLGGGALTFGGGGMAAGNALLALSGPIGWTIAGATLLSSIVIFASKRTKLNKEKNEEIIVVKENIARVKEMDMAIDALLKETTSLVCSVNECVKECMCLYGADYTSLNDEDKIQLGTLVNITKALSAYFDKTVE